MTPVPLKRLATVRVSNVDKKSVDGEPPVRLCNYTDVYYRNEITPRQEFMTASASPAQISAFRLHRDDVIITKDSETAEDIGVPAYVRSTAPDLVCGYHLAMLRPEPRLLDGRFLYWFMSSTTARDQLAVASTGVTRFGLRADSTRSMLVPSWPVEQQRAIAGYLDSETARIDALIAKKRSMATLLLSRRASLMSNWTEYLSKTHGVVPLRRLVVVEQGVSPVCDNQPAEVGEWGVLKTSAVSTGQFVACENKRLPDTTASDLRWKVDDGDLLMTRGSGSISSVGRAVVARTGGHQLLLSDLIYRLRLDEADPDFVALMLRSPRVRQRIEASIRSDVGQTLKLRVDDIYELEVSAVPAGEQERHAARIAADLEPHKQAIVRLVRQIPLLREHRQGLITAAVSGQLDVSRAA